MLEIKGKYTTALVTIDNVEDSCIEQIHKMVNHVAFDNPIVIMPDTHAGKGSVIGFTMRLGKKIVPSVVGVDIGCGMLSFKVNSLNITHERLDELIRENIPMGFNIHNTKSRYGDLEKFSFSKQFPWDKINETLNNFFTKYNKEFNTSYDIPHIDYRTFVDRYKKMKIDIKKVSMAIGTLGGGNHFLEISKSEKTGDIWITIHTGSRNFGKVVCEYHENVAKNNVISKRETVLKEYVDYIVKNTEDKTQINDLINLKKSELGLNEDLKGMEYLEGEDLKEYLIDMIIAQTYASFNRIHMKDIICEILGGVQPKEVIETVHNYIDFRDFTIRKGSISSYKNEKIIIPFNMRDGILLCEGKSNKEWNFSAPHGAGRVLSRGMAKNNIKLEKFQKQMEGIFSTSVCNGTLDEAPDAYKDSKMIEEAIEPTCTIIDRLIPIHNIKDKSTGESWKERREKKRRNKQRKLERKLKNGKN